MKRNFIALIFALTLINAYSQFSENYQIKAQYLYGDIMKHTIHLKNLVKGSVSGGEIAIEWKTAGENEWNKDYNYPIVGLGLNYINLSNPDTLGHSIALYPYINIPIIRNRYFAIYAKPGAGISYVTETFQKFKEDVAWGRMPYNKSNAAIGSHLNVFFSAGINMEIPVASGLILTADYAWNHISNGNMVVPNSGINILNKYVGLKYFPNHKYYTISNNDAPSGDTDKSFSLEASISGGKRQRYYLDSTPANFPIASIAVGVYKPLTNFYRLGLGIDMFYDGIYTDSLSLSRGFLRTYMEKDELKNKIRVGLSLQNEFKIGRLTAGIHAGIYLINPIKNLEPVNIYTRKLIDPMPYKGLIYPYDIEKEDGWFYTRISGKYMINNKWFASIGLKTHLQKAEFIEWGIGYKIL